MASIMETNTAPADEQNVNQAGLGTSTSAGTADLSTTTTSDQVGVSTTTTSDQVGVSTTTTSDQVGVSGTTTSDQVVDLTTTTGDVLTTAEMEAIQKKTSANKSQISERRSHFNEYVKCLFGFYPHNRFMLQYWNTEIGLLQNLYRLVRERCIFFYDPAVAMLYLKINGYVPLNSSAFYASNGLNENVDDGAYKQRFSSAVSSNRQSWSSIRKIPEAVWLKNILPYLCGPGGFPTSIITDDKFNLKCGGEYLGLKLKRSDNWLDCPLAIFDFPQLDGKAICLDTGKERFRSLSLPNKDSIPRNWNAKVEKTYENKEVTVRSFFEKGVHALDNSIMKRTPFVFMRGLLFFFIFSSLYDRAFSFSGLVVRNDLKECFDKIARCYTGKQHVLYWVFLSQFIYRMITETGTIASKVASLLDDCTDEEKKQQLSLLKTSTEETSMKDTFKTEIEALELAISLGVDIRTNVPVRTHLEEKLLNGLDWARRVNARLKGNINKTQKFDENKTKFGVQTRKSGMVVFIMSFKVFNHPIRNYGVATWVNFGIGMNKNDTSKEGVRGLTLLDVLKQWFKEFWEHPLSYYFQHSIQRPYDDTGLPTFSLTTRYNWQADEHNGWLSSSRYLHAMSLEYLDYDMQSYEYSPKWRCYVEELSEPEECRIRFQRNQRGSMCKDSEYMKVPYFANFWEILNEKFPQIMSNGLNFGFKSGSDTFSLTPKTTVADYVSYCHNLNDYSDLSGQCGLDVSVPSLEFLKVQNPEAFDNSYYGRAGDYHKMEDYKLPLNAWLREKFPWLEKENVFHAVKYMNGDVQPTEETTCIEFVKMCAGNDPLITLPNLQYVKVQNSRPFYGVNEGATVFDEELEKWPMNTTLKEIVNKIADRHPMLDANEVVLLPPMAITETSTLLDWMVVNNERGRVIKFKKVTVKLVEREPTDLYSNVEDYVEQSAFAMANLLKETLGDKMTYRRLSKQDGTYTFKRDYIFVRQDASDLDITCVVALLKLLYVFLYGKNAYEFRMGGQSFLECFKVFQHTFPATTVTAEALNKDKFEALPEFFKARLLSSEIARKFFGVVLLQQEKRDCSDRFFSPFEFALRKVQERTKSCNTYFSSRDSVERFSYAYELIVSEDPDVIWQSSSSTKKDRPRNYLIVRKVSCIPYTFLPHNALELSSCPRKREILYAFYMSQHNVQKGFNVSSSEEGGLKMIIFGKGSHYDNWPFNDLFYNGSIFDQTRNFPEIDFRYQSTTGKSTKVTTTKAISYYCKRYRYVGNGKFEENEKTAVVCAARSPTVCKPWDMFIYQVENGAYYKMENAYAEAEVWTEKVTEKQKATLLARAELNRKRAQPKKKRKRKKSSAGSSGSPSKRASTSSAQSNVDFISLLETLNNVISLTKSMVEGYKGPEEGLFKLREQLDRLEQKKKTTLIKMSKK